MRQFLLLTTSWCVVLCGAATLAQSTASSRPPEAKVMGRQSPAVLGSIRELMQDIVDPSADVLFEAVVIDATAAGVVKTMPTTDEAWKNVRRNALLLSEATHLLKMPGRLVAPLGRTGGVVSEPPSPGDLTTAEIQRLIDRDRPTFNRLAQGLADAAQLALKAADARSVDDLFASGDQIDQACENCHLRYWYPPASQPARSEAAPRKK